MGLEGVLAGALAGLVAGGAAGFALSVLRLTATRLANARRARAGEPGTKNALRVGFEKPGGVLGLVAGASAGALGQGPARSALVALAAVLAAALGGLALALALRARGGGSGSAR